MDCVYISQYTQKWCFRRTLLNFRENTLPSICLFVCCIIRVHTSHILIASLSDLSTVCRRRWRSVWRMACGCPCWTWSSWRGRTRVSWSSSLTIARYQSSHTALHVLNPNKKSFLKATTFPFLFHGVCSVPVEQLFILLENTPPTHPHTHTLIF